MFDFEKFIFYLKTEDVYRLLVKSVFSKKFDNNLKDQLKRSSTSIMLNIAEGSGKSSKADKKNFYLIARGSVFESVAILRILKIEGIIDEELYSLFYKDLEEIGKMLSGLINSMVKKT